jgi:hypothetical protein
LYEIRRLQFIRDPNFGLKDEAAVEVVFRYVDLLLEMTEEATLYLSSRISGSAVLLVLTVLTS